MTQTEDGGSPGGQPPGWYTDVNGEMRWWDGSQWGQTSSEYNAAGQPHGYYQQPMVQTPRIMPPPPPWGTWMWADGTPIDMDSLPSYDSSKKLVVGLLAIFVGSLGIHKFILGNTAEGALTIVLSIVTCGIFAMIPLIEGIIYLTKSDEEFYWTYVVGKKKWF